MILVHFRCALSGANLESRLFESSNFHAQLTLYALAKMRGPTRLLVGDDLLYAYTPCAGPTTLHVSVIKLPVEPQLVLIQAASVLLFDALGVTDDPEARALLSAMLLSYQGNLASNNVIERAYLWRMRGGLHQDASAQCTLRGAALAAFLVYRESVLLALVASIDRTLSCDQRWHALDVRIRELWTSYLPRFMLPLLREEVRRLGHLGMHLPRFEAHFHRRFGLGSTWIAHAIFPLYQCCKHFIRP